MGLNNGKFSIMTSLPAKGNKFYNTTGNGGYSHCIQGSPVQSGRNVYSNCVGHSCSRFNEVYALLTGYNGMKFPYLNCNAENFIERAKNTYGLEVKPYPVLGGIMVWQKGATLSGNDGAGHVEFVEDIYGANEIYISGSGWGSSNPLWNARRTNSNGRWGMASGYTFRGCIVNPAIGDVHWVNQENPTDNTKFKYNVGDKVKFTGILYKNSIGEGAGQSRTNFDATITLRAKDPSVACPYNINNGLGWVKESALTPITPAFTKGNYKTKCNMNVRTGAGTNYSIKKVSQLTADGKKNATSQNPNANAVYKSGTIFTALEIISNNYGTWAKTPSGYVCIKGASGTVYCSKI